MKIRCLLLGHRSQLQFRLHVDVTDPRGDQNRVISTRRTCERCGTRCIDLLTDQVNAEEFLADMVEAAART